MKELEVRSAPLSPPDDGRILRGHAAVFNTPTNIAGLFLERIAPGAFAGALAGDVHALLDHDYGRVIGRTTSGTLKLREDGVGLAVEIDLPMTADGTTALELVKRRDLTGMSFAFTPVREEWDDSGDLPMRTLLQIELFEVSIVARPAYPTTDIAARIAARRQAPTGKVNAAAHRARLKMELDARLRGI